MVLSKELTIKEILDEMQLLKAKLIKLNNRRVMLNTHISAITWKDVVSSGGIKGDIMTNKLIKKERLQDEFEVVLESYDSYKEMAIEKIREMLKTKTVDECIVYFRDTLHWKWKEICKLFNYSRSQASKRYYDFKNRTTSDTIGH